LARADSSIVDEDIDSSEGFDCSLDDLLAILDAVVIGDGLATSLYDLVYYNIGGLS